MTLMPKLPEDVQALSAQQSALTHAVEAMQNGDVGTALRVLQELCTRWPESLQGWKYLAIALDGAGQNEIAETVYEKVLSQTPWDHMLLHSYSGMLGVMGRYEQAIEVIRKAIAVTPQLEYRQHLVAMLFNGDFLDQAQMELNSLLQGACDLDVCLYYQARIQHQQGLYEQALQSYQALTTIAPRHVLGIIHKGIALKDLGDLESAVACYQWALQINPQQPEGWVNLAVTLERLNRLEEAQQALETAWNLVPNNPLLRLVKIRLYRHAQRFDDALAELEAFKRESLALIHKKELAFEEGAIFAALQETSAAMRAFARGHQLAYAALSAEQQEESFQFLMQLKDRAALIEQAQVATDGPSTEASPIFFLGFPCSGSSLLSSLLDNHLSLSSMLEKSSLAVVWEKLVQEHGLNERHMGQLTPALRALGREYYWQACGVTPNAPAQWLDSMPLNVLYLPLLVQLFPNAKSVLLVRHPYGVCLSAYMQDFQHNPTVAQFHELGTAATLYSETMDFWCQAQHRFALQPYTVRYEDLLSDATPVLQPLLAYLGQPCDDVATLGEALSLSMQHPATHHCDWQAYGPYLHAVQAPLQRWLSYWGYDA
ncbi:Tetratricopeptide TPR_2 repeat protein [Magnetococcus marinus MC-1]|uniref:Tetratricopeptide TPR_2 repeat protein n=1 Tax=Magnetococcus marinus (strain ATCC BAA-1437 / JCM 17883 / MC-1) TaxID=156889 RepID=A0L8W2_MAGMM|nr:tetratricopeptide repeat-containing sulfotransferase family protein [Magnetococcus marinus]ABK44405.1 Tetratricopeptide TPR_2 repeat protein [Magnetococcus marinus MC-1]